MLPHIAARFSLRPATAVDFVAVDALLARSDPRPHPLAPDNPASVRVLAIPLISRARPDLLVCGSYWLALDPQGGVLGAGGWTHGAPGAPEDGARPATGHIRHFVTDADCLRQGIGRALMDLVVAQAGADGVEWLDCLSTRTVVPFYAQMGFQAQGLVDVPLRPGIVFPAIRMLRRL